MKSFFFILFCSTLLCLRANSQGCVAIRSLGGVCTLDHMNHVGTDSIPSKWQFSLNNRYFESFRHYVGTEEQKQRVDGGTEVINHAYSMDLGLVHNVTYRLSIGFYIPIISNTRSSLYEHGGKERHTTKSFGIGDTRVSAFYWLLNPVKKLKGNIQAGLGIKLPTGDYRYQDRFYSATPGVTIMGPVDQSIQLGDGGTGFTTELNAYYMVSRTVSVYGNFFYLINPREQNGVSTARGGVPSASSIQYGSDVMSVPDQYMYRVGANFTIQQFTFTTGMRNECIPVYDLVGGSNGFRRPGYVVSFEPGISYSVKKINLYAYVPVAVTRNRTQSVPDKIRTDITGVYAQGDAAFADYALNIGMSIRF